MENPPIISNNISSHIDLLEEQKPILNIDNQEYKTIDDGINMLLHGNGAKFLESYYDYIDKIYNYQIPIKDIASKGKIKKTIEEYKKDCNTCR